MGVFHFKQFDIDDCQCGMKIGTDGVLLGAWAQLYGNRVLDVGCGSGLVALMMAQRYAEAHITALDIDANAAEAARANFEASPWGGRLTATEGDFLQFAQSGWDVIVSNPPFFATGQRAPQDSRSVARHQDTLPLDALIAHAAQLLAPTGQLALITPADNPDQIVFAAEMSRLKLRRRCDVRTKPGVVPKRILWQFGLVDGPIIHEEIVIGDDYYTALTRPFYLDK